MQWLSHKVHLKLVEQYHCYCASLKLYQSLPKQPRDIRSIWLIWPTPHCTAQCTVHCTCPTQAVCKSYETISLSCPGLQSTWSLYHMLLPGHYSCYLPIVVPSVEALASFSEQLKVQGALSSVCQLQSLQKNTQCANCAVLPTVSRWNCVVFSVGSVGSVQVQEVCSVQVVEVYIAQPLRESRMIKLAGSDKTQADTKPVTT